MSNFFNSRPATSEARTYVTINGTDMRTFGLELTDYKIGAPVPVINLIDVPGRSGKLDATEALNGYVNYSGRSIEMTFHVKKSYTEWHGIISALSEAFDGVEDRVTFSKDPDWHYKGRFKIDFIKSNPVSGDVVMSCDDCSPFKLQLHEGTIELPGYPDGISLSPQHSWKYMSEIEIIPTILEDGYIYFHSNMQDVETYGSRDINMFHEGKKYYIYYGNNEFRRANYFYTSSRIHSDNPGAFHYRFEVGVF